MTKLLIVDDHQMFLDGLKSMLEKEGGFEITLANNAAEVLKAFNEQLFDIAIIDIEMPDSSLNGVELTKQLTRKYPNLGVLVVSMNKTASAVEELIEVGAKGYVIKDSGYNELSAAIKKLVNGEEHWDPKILQLLVNATREKNANTKEASAQMDQVVLTAREKDVLNLLAQGLSSKEMAENLFIGTSTIDTHRKNLIAKFGAKNSTEVVVKARELGLT